MNEQKRKDLKFFVVDDDPFSRMLYQRHLLNLGYQNNILFENGDECIDKLNLEPDIVLLDYDMKPFNGLQVLQIIKKYNPNIQLILISSIKDSQVASDAIKYGAIDYIIKDEQDIELLTNGINKILKITESSGNQDGLNYCIT
jgi:DNA-binding NtrC family response regulator